MSNLPLNLNTQELNKRQRELRAVWVFILVTLVLTVSLLLLLPGLAGPFLVVFIPTIVAVILIRLTAGKGKIRPLLFSQARWVIRLKWLLITVGLAIGLRLGVSLLGLALIQGYEFQPDSLPPLFLIVAFLFAAGEEIGWRGFALPTLLKNDFHPLLAVLILGVPWALLHLPLTLPDMLSAGTPMLAQFLVTLSMSVLTAWVFLASGGSLTAAVLLHGGQNVTAILNGGLSANDSGWLMAVVYGLSALIIIVLTRGHLGLSAYRRN